MSTADIYFSCDVEADGPIPGPYSMSSFGLSVVGRYDGASFEPSPLGGNSFYAELRPISDRFVPEAAAVSGLDRDELIRSGQDPAVAMSACATWVREQGTALSGKPVFVAYPLGFDWMFMYWYFVSFAQGGSPFGFSSALDMKTLYAARSGATMSRSTKRSMPKHLLSARQHTHNALDDATEQGELMANLVRWRPELPPLPAG